MVQADVNPVVESKSDQPTRAQRLRLPLTTCWLSSSYTNCPKLSVGVTCRPCVVLGKLRSPVTTQAFALLLSLPTADSIQTPHMARTKEKSFQVQPRRNRSPSSSPLPPSSDRSQSSPPAPAMSKKARLLSQSKETTEQWYKSKRTLKGYAGYVKAGRGWLVDAFPEEEQEGDEDGRLLDEDENAEMRTGFDVLSESTPLALRLFTTYKTEVDNCKFKTAEGIRSAFKDYFARCVVLYSLHLPSFSHMTDSVLGCQGDFWRLNAYSGQWEGNPVFEPTYNAYYESLRNRARKTETTNQALPMLPKDLKIIINYLDSQEGKQHFSETKRLYFKAFATTAFTLWTRSFVHFQLIPCQLLIYLSGMMSLSTFNPNTFSAD